MSEAVREAVAMADPERCVPSSIRGGCMDTCFNVDLLIGRLKATLRALGYAPGEWRRSRCTSGLSTWLGTPRRGETAMGRKTEPWHPHGTIGQAGEGREAWLSGRVRRFPGS